MASLILMELQETKLTSEVIYNGFLMDLIRTPPTPEEFVPVMFFAAAVIVFLWLIYKLEFFENHQNLRSLLVYLVLFTCYPTIITFLHWCRTSGYSNMSYNKKSTQEL